MASNQLRLCQAIARTFNTACPLSFLLKRYPLRPGSSLSLTQRRFSYRSVVNVQYSLSSHRIEEIEKRHPTGYLRQISSSTSLEELETLYRLRWIKYLRFISRVKIVHVVVVTSLTWPMTYWFSQGLVSFPSLIASAVAATATTVGLFVLSYFLRRVVGQMSINRSNATVVISTLTFWGNRRNKVLRLSDLVPLGDSGFDSNHIFHRLELYNSPDVYLCTLRYGEIYDRESFLSVIGLCSKISNETRDAKPEKQDTQNTSH